MKKVFLWLAPVFIILLGGFAFIIKKQSIPQTDPVSKGVEPPWTQPKACRVKDLQLIDKGGGGTAWSPTTDSLFFYSKYDPNHVKQIYQHNLTTKKVVCLTCEKTKNSPPTKVHKGVLSLDPTGRYLVMQVEMADHPWKIAVGEPGTGWFQNIWPLDLKTNQWWQLTNYPTSPPHGVLFPRISPDGQKLAWAQLYQGGGGLRTLLYHLGLSTSANPWGYWKINIADFVTDHNEVRLENIKSYLPGQANFYEMQEWSPDSQSIMFAADINRSNPHVLDIYLLDLGTNKLKALTDTNNHWEEHASFSPDGEKIVYMSSECCFWNPASWKSLVAEHYLINADGTNKVQLTHFNQPGYPESQTDQGRAIAASVRWSPDGTRLLAEQVLMTQGHVFNKDANLWLITFNGPCGLSP